MTHYIDILTKKTGYLSAILTLLIGYDAMMRYLFSAGSIALQEVEGRSPVGGDCYHTIYLKLKTDFFFMLIVGAMVIAPYGFFYLKSLSARFHFMPILFNGALGNSTLRIF